MEFILLWENGKVDVSIVQRTCVLCTIMHGMLKFKTRTHCCICIAKVVKRIQHHACLVTVGYIGNVLSCLYKKNNNNYYYYYYYCHCRSQWTRSLRRRSAAAWLLRSWVRIPPEAWIFVCCECCVLSGRGLCDELITRPEESYHLCCVVVCDLVTSRMGAPYMYIWH
jgi:hypothetical protein